MEENILSEIILLRFILEMSIFFFFQAKDGIRTFCLSRGLGGVYKRQVLVLLVLLLALVLLQLSLSVLSSSW